MGRSTRVLVCKSIKHSIQSKNPITFEWVYVNIFFIKSNIWDIILNRNDLLFITKYLIKYFSFLNATNQALLIWNTISWPDDTLRLPCLRHIITGCVKCIRWRWYQSWIFLPSPYIYTLIHVVLKKYNEKL